MDLDHWLKELNDALVALFPGEDAASLNPCFAEKANQLAYLAYTGKIENHVRDCLAHALDAKRQASGQGSAGREIRVENTNYFSDLAAFDDADSVEAYLQAKAIYLGNLLGKKGWRGKPDRQLNALADDVTRKAQHPPNSATKLPSVGLLIVTDIPNYAPNPPPKRLAYDDLVALQAREGIVAHLALRQSLRSNSGAGLLSLTTQGPKQSPTPAPLQLTAHSGVWTGQYGNVCVRVHWFLVHG
ncbi:hypothetical protein [Roseateles sp.]|uniref:hypothetical protein n=1 Tax=Roseateles sp. TaxID=1971397 RepID=UPI0039232818